MLTLVLADSELELVPKEIQSHPSVRNYAKNRGKSPTKILLDSSYHHPALKKIPQGDRRGRPDIAHVFLLICLDSIVNIEGGLRTILHTRNNEMINVAPETRIPKNYNRFVGLIEDLYEKGQVPEAGSPLMTIEKDKDLTTILKDISDKSIALDPRGKSINLTDFFKEQKGSMTFVIGGFPHGDFITPVKEVCSEVVSISTSSLKAWTVASEILVCYGRCIGLTK